MMGNSVSRFQRPDIQNPDRIFYNDIHKSAYSILPTLYNKIKGSKRQTEFNLCAPKVNKKKNDVSSPSAGVITTLWPAGVL
jgi:hypothetical protein